MIFMGILLEHTVDLMISDDFRDRFVAEYHQLKTRCEGLEAMLKKFKEGSLPFKPVTPYNVLESQLVSMLHYKEHLEHRAELEGINLGGVSTDE